MYLNALAMLAVTIAGFVVLAKAAQALRTRGGVAGWRGGALLGPPAASARLAVEQACMIDAKRRLLLVRCDGQRVLLLTGGPADLVVSAPPDLRAAGAGA